MSIILKLIVLNIYVKIIGNELTIVIRKYILHEFLQNDYSTN
jgi:hypothetical protein